MPNYVLIIIATVIALFLLRAVWRVLTATPVKDVPCRPYGASHLSIVEKLRVPKYPVRSRLVSETDSTGTVRYHIDVGVRTWGEIEFTPILSSYGENYQRWVFGEVLSEEQASCVYRDVMKNAWGVKPVLKVVETMEVGDG